MTYIEFFTPTSVENICACLAHAPQRVVLIGDKHKLLRHHAQRYARLFADRGLTVEFICRSVSRNNMSAILQTLTELVERYDDCAFGLTGGEELYLVAVGMICARYPEKKPQMHRFNISNGAIVDCDEDGTTIPIEDFHLSIAENVRIYGGDLVSDPEQAPAWDMHEDFKADIRSMWELCSRNVRKWNAQAGILAAAVKIGATEDGLMYTLSQSQLKRHTNRSRVFFPEILEPLKKQGLLKLLDWGSDEVSLVFKSQQVKRCLVKAGLALEMYIYMAALDARDRDGAPVYHDVMNGVSIDWDGQLREDTNDAQTRNEIDVLMMHGVVPVFVSCKNGTVSIDELYKLSSVAEKFGGPYARKVLVATALQPKTEGKTGDDFLRQRAKDMGIRLIEDTREAELSRSMRSLWRG